MCSKINKNSETDIGVEPEDQKSKAASHWLITRPQFKNGGPASVKSQNETMTENTFQIFRRALFIKIQMDDHTKVGREPYHIIKVMITTAAVRLSPLTFEYKSSKPWT